MRRVDVFHALGDIDSRYVAEASRYAPGEAACAPERTATVKKRMITFALAAALVLALGITAFAVWNIHAARQQELRADLQIEESGVESYHEYDVPSAAGSGLTLLSTINDGEFQKVYVNVSPVGLDVIERFPGTVSFAWTLDGISLNGEEYWMVAGPRLKGGRSVSGYEEIRQAVLEDAYDEETETLTLECHLSNEAIRQAQEARGRDSVLLTVTLWDHQASADAGGGNVAEWLRSQESFGSVWVTPTDLETRYIDFHGFRYQDEASGKTISVIGLELSPTSAVWKFDYEDAEKIHADRDQGLLVEWGQIQDRVSIDAMLVFSDGETFSTGGALRNYYENGTVNAYCSWEKAIDIKSVTEIRLGDQVLWQADQPE